MKYKILPFFTLLVIGCCNATAQSITFSSDSLDASKVVTELTIDKQVYMHITLLKPLNKTSLFDFSELPPKSTKSTSCDLGIKIYRKGDVEPKYEKIFEIDDDGPVGSNIDYSSTEIVVPFLPDDKWGRIGFSKFINEMKEGTEAYQVVVVPNSDRGWVAKKKLRPRGEINITKKPGDTFKYNYTFENNFKVGMKDAALEQKILVTANINGKEELKKVYKAVTIISRDWVLVRDRYTDVVLGKKILCNCYAKLDDGSCKVFKIWFWKEFDGVSYSNTIYYLSTLDYGRGELVDCTID